MVTPESFLDGKAILFPGDCLDVLPGFEPNSFDACVTDGPYGLEFMGKEWDGADGFRRSLNGADAGRENVFGRTSKHGPEYRAVGVGCIGAPGIGQRATEWVSHQGWNQFRCGGCGHLFHGGSPCQCETPQPVRADNRWPMFQQWCEAWARQVFRVLKPGGHLISFGGTRTYHRMVCGVEDAGFEVRDLIAWMFGQGFPKSLNVAIEFEKRLCEQRLCGDRKEWFYIGAEEKMRRAPPFRDDDANEWAGWGTAFKPALEPICIARKPLERTVAENVAKWGIGALNIDGCRVATDEGLNGGAYRDGEASAERTYADKGGTNFAMKPGMRRGRSPMNGDERSGAALGMFQEGKTVGTDFKQPPGRWPANVIHDGSEEVVGAFPDTKSGELLPHHHKTGNGLGGTSTFEIRDRTGEAAAVYGDQGSASRFFYTAKADADDRLGSKHPTVKPLDLMQYLVRLVTPPGGLVLDPFAGTGTTGEAAFREGMRAVLIEREQEYQNDIRRRMALVMSGPAERKRESAKARPDKPFEAGSLFASP